MEEIHEEKRLNGFIVVCRGQKRVVTDVQVVKSIFERSNQLAVLLEKKVHEKWVFKKPLRIEKSLSALEMLKSEEVGRDHRQKGNEVLSSLSETTQNRKE